MDFGNALKLLSSGETVRRDSWDEGVFITKQIPSYIHGFSVVNNIHSLSDKTKRILLKQDDPSITYEHQILVINKNKATYWIPKGEDLFAQDWTVYESNVEDSYRDMITLSFESVSDTATRLDKLLFESGLDHTEFTAINEYLAACDEFLDKVSPVLRELDL